MSFFLFSCSYFSAFTLLMSPPDLDEFRKARCMEDQISPDLCGGGSGWCLFCVTGMTTLVCPVTDVTVLLVVNPKFAGGVDCVPICEFIAIKICCMHFFISFRLLCSPLVVSPCSVPTVLFFDLYPSVLLVLLLLM